MQYGQECAKKKKSQATFLYSLRKKNETLSSPCSLFFSTPPTQLQSRDAPLLNLKRQWRRRPPSIELPALGSSSQPHFFLFRERSFILVFWVRGSFVTPPQSTKTCHHRTGHYDWDTRAPWKPNPWPSRPRSPPLRPKPSILLLARITKFWEPRYRALPLWDQPWSKPSMIRPLELWPAGGIAASNFSFFSVPIGCMWSGKMWEFDAVWDVTEHESRGQQWVLVF